MFDGAPDWQVGTFDVLSGLIDDSVLSYIARLQPPSLDLKGYAPGASRMCCNLSALRLNLLELWAYHEITSKFR